MAMSAAPTVGTLTRAVAELATLLPELPQAEADRPEAEARAAAWAARWPELDLELVAFPNTDRPTVEYDVLLAHPAGGTLALSYAPDDGLPWVARFGENQVPYRLAAVNGEFITVRAALFTLEASGRDQELFDRMITAELVRQAVRDRKIDVVPEALQEAMDTFRRARGLLTAESTHRWLEAHGLTHAQLEKLLGNVARGRALRDEVVAGGVPGYFADHRAAFNRAIVVRAATTDGDLAAALVGAVRAGADLAVAVEQRLRMDPEAELEARLVAVRRRDLAAAAAAAVFGATVGAVVGPFALPGATRVETSHELFQVVDVQPAVLDRETRRLVEDAVFREWLDDARRRAHVVWHLR